MADVNWQRFQALSGAADRNFELLCQELVRRNYARHGNFRYTSMQPGVEFHLELLSSCDLGERPRWWGWQCKWYTPTGSHSLSTSRKRAIRESLSRTLAHLPRITDWVLWTPFTLSNSDQDWVRSLSDAVRFHFWTHAEILGLSAGSASVVFDSYFGRFALSNDDTERIWRQSTAAVQDRWIEELVVPDDVYASVRTRMADRQYWDEIATAGSRTRTAAVALQETLNAVPDLHPAAEALLQACMTAADYADCFSDPLRGPEFDAWSMESPRPLTVRDNRDVRRYGSRLRAGNNFTGILLEQALGELNILLLLTHRYAEAKRTSALAVVGGAGYGKTHLSVELTRPQPAGPAGALLFARPISKTSTIDDLAKSLPGAGFGTFEELVETYEAIGRRAGTRVVIAIDGLNESEDPTVWKGMLSTAEHIVARHRFTYLVVTVRPQAKPETLPDSFATVLLSGFGRQLPIALDKYLSYYKIDVKDLSLLSSHLQHPLFLQFFCRATNPTRKQTVGVESIPKSLTEVFNRFVDSTVRRVASLCDVAPRSVEEALFRTANLFWLRRTRRIPFDEVRRELDFHGPDWNRSVARRLEEEGLIERASEAYETNESCGFIYDALGGYLIARGILLQIRSRVELSEWARQPETVALTSGDFGVRHPLAEDVIVGLAGLAPRRTGTQLWPLLELPAKDVALIAAASLEAELVDGETSAEVRRVIGSGAWSTASSLFSRLRETRRSVGHPLNGRFLHSCLQEMDLVTRDLRWSEWLRRTKEGTISDLERLEVHWSRSRRRTTEDELAARWCMWTLSSSVRRLRDQAIKCLQNYGRFSVATLFTLTREALYVDDPYIGVGMMGALYGALMTSELHADLEVEAQLRSNVSLLIAEFQAPACPRACMSWLSREYLVGIVSYCCEFYPESSPSEVSIAMPFGENRAWRESVEASDPRASELSYALQMDFERHTIGNIYSHSASPAVERARRDSAIALVRGSVWACGWRRERFEDIDREIGERQFSRSRWEPRVDRYGKKYGWIGYYETAASVAPSTIASWVADGQRLPDIDVDPSFIYPPPPAPFELERWTAATVGSDLEWVESGVVSLPDTLWTRSSLSGNRGPWLLIDGYLRDQDSDSGRDVFALLRAVLARAIDVPPLRVVFEREPFPGDRFLPPEPSDYYTFGGEIPWSPRFAQDVDSSEGAPSYDVNVRSHHAPALTVEFLSHNFSWESYHSELNPPGAHAVPSARVSRNLKLRPVPGTFHQQDEDGQLAVLCYSHPDGFANGHLLYLRRDLLAAYVGSSERSIVWLMWGERGLTSDRFANATADVKAAFHAFRHVWKTFRSSKL